MTTYNTGNPIGSTAVKDLFDNAENLDHLVNDPVAETWPDRLGVDRKTWHGIEVQAQLEIDEAAAAAATAATAAAEGYRDESEAARYAAQTAQAGAEDARDDAVAAAGAIGPLEFPDTYADALAMAAGVSPRQLFEIAVDETRDGARTRYWAELGSLDFVIDLDLRFDLENAKPMQSYTALRTYTGRASSVRITTPGVSGFFQRLGGVQGDNGGTFIVDGLGRTWERLYSGAVFLSWFLGAKSIPTLDATPALVRAIDASDEIIVDGTFYLLTGLSKTVSKTVKFQGVNSAKFIVVGNYGLRITAAVIATSAPTGNIAMLSTSVPLVSAIGFSAGDLVYLWSTQPSEGQWNYQCRLPFNVKAVSGNTITLSDPSELDYNHTTYPVTAENYGNITFGWDSIDFELRNNAGGALRWHGFQNPEVNNVFVNGVAAANPTIALAPYVCIGAKTNNIRAKDIHYPLISTYSRGGTFRNTSAKNAGHVIDTAMTANDRFYGVTGIDCGATLNPHPSFNTVVDGVDAIGDTDHLGFRTWGGALRNVRHRFADSVTTGAGSYFQSIEMNSPTIDPYTLYPFDIENVVSFPNANGIRLWIGNGDKSRPKMRFNNIDVDAIAFGTVGLNTSTLALSNAKLRQLDYRGPKIKLVDVEFEGNATHTYAIWESTTDAVGGPVGVMANNVSFKGYDRVIRSITSATVQYQFANASFEDITGQVFYSQGGMNPGNISLVNANFKNAASYCNATNGPAFQHENTKALGTSPALPLTSAFSFNPASLAAGAGETTTASVLGAALGDLVAASFSLDLQGVSLSAWVSAANTVSVRFQNGTTASIDLGNGTLRVRVRKP